MLCRRLLKGRDEVTQTFTSDPDPCYHRANMTGYVTEEGTVFFCEEEPLFCPATGKSLTIVTHLPGESLHDLVD